MLESQVVARSIRGISLAVLTTLLATACVPPQPAPRAANLTNTAPPVAVTSTTPPVYARSAVSNTRQKIDHEFFVNADCSTGGIPVVVVTTPPAHGTLWSEPGSDYPLFNKENQRYDCNKLPIAGAGLFYKSNDGFYGTDTATIHVINPNGTFRDVSYSIIVK